MKFFTIKIPIPDVKTFLKHLDSKDQGKSPQCQDFTAKRSCKEHINFILKFILDVPQLGC